MEIKECRISGFGKYVNETIKMDSNLFVLCKENGFGKTTLFAFIMAMIYGYEKKNKFDDREHYAPFNSPNYGGSIIVLHDGKTYQIERTFGRTSKSDDTVKLYIDSKEVKRKIDDIGEKYFKVSEEVFRKTMLITENDFDCSLDVKLVDRLTSSVSGDEGANIALNNLEELRKLVANGKDGLEALEKTIRDQRKDTAIINELIEDIDFKKRETKETKESLLKLDEKIRKYDQEKGKKILHDSIKSKKEQLNEIKRQYPLGLPTQSEFEEISISLSNIEKLEYGIYQSKANSDNSIFISDEAIDSLEEKIKAIDNISKDITVSNFDSEFEELQRIYNEEDKKTSIWPIIGVLAMFLGGVVLTFVLNALVGIIVSIVSLVLLIVLICIAKKNKGQNKEVLFRSKINAPLKDTKSIDELYSLLCKSNEAKKTKDALEKEITSAFASFGIINSSYIEGLKVLNEAKMKNKSFKRIEEDKELIKNEEKNIQRISSKYQLIINKDNINILKEKAMEIISLEKDISSISYEETKDEEIDQIDIEYVNNKRQEASKSLETALSQLGSMENKLVQLEEKKIDLNNNEQTFKDKEHKVMLVKKAKELILQAQDNLKKEYVDPIRKDFDKYAMLIEENLGKDIVISSDFSVYLNKFNQRYDWHHLSTGEKTILILCFRLALAESLVKGSKHFIVLDDPFAYLDKSHLQKAKKMIKELSKDMQIIYLTCSEERNIV